jgi:hypothetical protein
MDWSAAAELVVGALGEAATHCRAEGDAAITVVLRKDLHRDPLAFAEPIRTDQVVLEVLTSDAATPERGDVVRVGATEYHVDRVDHASDELITRLICSDRSG